jgi:hypothetical protein
MKFVKSVTLKTTSKKKKSQNFETLPNSLKDDFLKKLIIFLKNA